MFLLPAISNGFDRVRRICTLRIMTGNIVWLTMTYAQQSSAPFAALSDTPLGFKPASLGLLHDPGQPFAVAVSSAALPEIRLYRSGDQGELVLFRSLELSSPQRTVKVADIDGDGKMEFVCLAARAPEVTIVKPSGETIGERRLSLDGDARYVTVGDFTNDGRPDLLFYGKGLAGVATMIGTGKGGFRTGPRLFPEISSADVQLFDLNGDQISDVLLLDWLSNRAVLFFGINGKVFSEQVTVPLPGEPAKMAVAPGYRKRNFQVAITLPELRQIVVFAALASGEFHLTQTIDCPGIPRSVILGDVNHDRLPDLVAATDQGTLVALGNTRGGFEKGNVLGSQAGEELLGLGDLDGDGRPDLLLADRETALLTVIWNAQSDRPLSWPRSYAVGAMPRGLALADVNDDGKMDIAVANQGSATISVLLGKGGGKFEGEQSIAVADGPAFLRALPASDATDVTLIVMHRPGDVVSLIRLGSDLAHSSALSVVTDQSPYVLSASGPPGKLSMLVRSSGRTGRSVSLFEQISEEQFIERRFRPSIPPSISALTMSTTSQNRELVFVTGAKPAQILVLPLAGPGGTFSMRVPRELCELPDTLQSVSNILAHDIDGDGIPDLLLVGGSPHPSVGVLLRNGDTTSTCHVSWYSSLQPKGTEGAILADTDGDGLQDLVILDELQNKILLLRGSGGGQFNPPVPVCSASGVNNFVIGPVTARGSVDLVLSNSSKGTVSILRAPFVRQRHE